MKVFSSKVHGYIDYTLGIALLLAPNLFGFADEGGAPVWIARGIGLLILGQSLVTDYELSVAKMIPFKMHVMMDLGASLFLAASPWLFGFSDLEVNAWMPHVLAGLSYFVISALTETRVGVTPSNDLPAMSK